jgi:2-methylcitrate dehydratase PrpD
MTIHPKVFTLNTPDTLTSGFAKFVTKTGTGSLDEAVTQAASRALTDTLGVGLGGREDHASGIAAQWVLATAGAPHATLWGRTERASPADAAFLNAIQAHVLDYDDSSLNPYRKCRTQRKRGRAARERRLYG